MRHAVLTCTVTRRQEKRATDAASKPVNSFNHKEAKEDSVVMSCDPPFEGEFRENAFVRTL
jgi:hypothetical protein